MEEEEKVVSLELAKELKAKGYKQEGEFWWNLAFETLIPKINLSYHPVLEKYENQHKAFYKATGRLISAPLAVELLERLPKRLKYKGVISALTISTSISTFAIYYSEIGGEHRSFLWNEDVILPNALAKMWLYFTKQGLIE